MQIEDPNQFSDDDDWNPNFGNSGSISDPVKLRYTNKEIKQKIKQNESYETSFQKRFLEYKNLNKDEEEYKKTIEFLNKYSDDEGEDEGVPKSAVDWKNGYKSDDMDILYDPIKDIMVENDIVRKSKKKFSKVQRVLNCGYCFTRVTFGDYDPIYDWSKEEVEGFVCLNLEGVLLDTENTRLESISQGWYRKWKGLARLERKKKRDKGRIRGVVGEQEEEEVRGILELEGGEGKFLKEVPDVVFNVCCLGCKKRIGEFHHSKKVYYLDGVVQSSG